MKIIPELKHKAGIWVLIPTVIWFFYGEVVSDTENRDLTMVWLCFGVTFRFPVKGRKC